MYEMPNSSSGMFVLLLYTCNEDHFGANFNQQKERSRNKVTCHHLSDSCVSGLKYYLLFEKIQDIVIKVF